MGKLMKTWTYALAALAICFNSAHAAKPSGAAMAVPSPSSATKPAPGPTGAAMAATCAGCHGTDGKLATVEMVPLAGMAEAEFVRAMQDFRSGKRQSTLMGNLAKGFSEREVAAMARYFVHVKKQGK
jgi:sulfide dehydrogenase cytochrome subunit